MAKVTTNIRLDSELKAQAQALFEDFGLDLTTAITIFLKQSVHENCIPFSIRREYPNSDSIAALKEAEEIRKNPDAYPAYETMDDFKKAVLELCEED